MLVYDCACVVETASRLYRDGKESPRLLAIGQFDIRSCLDRAATATRQEDLCNKGTWGGPSTVNCACLAEGFRTKMTYEEMTNHPSITSWISTNNCYARRAASQEARAAKPVQSPPGAPDPASVNLARFREREQEFGADCTVKARDRGLAPPQGDHQAFVAFQYRCQLEALLGEGLASQSSVDQCTAQSQYRRPPDSEQARKVQEAATQQKIYMCIKASTERSILGTAR